MKRTMPQSEVIASEKNSPKLPRRPPMGERAKPIADELNRQREKPSYDVHRKRTVEK